MKSRIATILTSAALLSACAHHPVRTLSPADEAANANLVGKLSAPEKTIHSCLSEVDASDAESADKRAARKACLEKTDFDPTHARVPTASSAELMQMNRWLFDSPEKLSAVQNVITGIRQMAGKLKSKLGEATLEAVEEKGIGFQGEATLGIGASWLAELDVHDHKLGLFCAPGIVAETDAGISATLEIGKSLNCASNEAYSGGFLSFEAGVSGELLALPFELGVAYAFGVDGKKFFNDTKQLFRTGAVKTDALVSEMKTLENIAPSQLRSALGGSASVVAIDYTMKIVSALLRGQIVPKAVASIEETARALNHESIGNRIKGLVASKRMAHFAAAHHLPNLNVLVSTLAQSLSGCDAVGGGASMGVSVAPVSVGVNYSDYALLLEVPLDQFEVLKAINPLTLLNPSLLSYSQMESVIDFAQSVMKFRDKVENGCSLKKIVGIGL